MASKPQPPQPDAPLCPCAGCQQLRGLAWASGAHRRPLPEEETVYVPIRGRHRGGYGGRGRRGNGVRLRA